MRDLWWISNWAALAVVLLVWVLVAIVIVRFRRRDDSLPSQRAYNIPVEVLYTVAPLVVVGVLVGLTVAVQEDVTDTVDDPDVVVEVTGFRWQWEFEYVDEGVTVVGTNEELPELVLPVGQTVRLDLRSADVIHSFWVPRFLAKRDLIPRIDNEVDLEVTEPGRWEGKCAEFCGLDHATMNFTVRAVPADQFETWVEDSSS